MSVAAMKCPQCKKEIPDSAKYCPECGHKIPYTASKEQKARPVASTWKAKQLRHDAVMYVAGVVVGIIMIVFSIISEGINLGWIGLGLLLISVGGAGCIITRIRIWRNRKP